MRNLAVIPFFRFIYKYCFLCLPVKHGGYVWTGNSRTVLGHYTPSCNRKLLKLSPEVGVIYIKSVWIRQFKKVLSSIENAWVMVTRLYLCGYIRQQNKTFLFLLFFCCAKFGLHCAIFVHLASFFLICIMYLFDSR